MPDGSRNEVNKNNKSPSKLFEIVKRVVSSFVMIEACVENWSAPG